ncbi:Asp23/Gls24 family envelope stress response protein [Cryptosporangium japonicum]|uniref:Asp23/Gls24 family envelope stress response protein n=1 Tax=Cryptosporangium japonicum TaxID=80872 RepID=A0ABP3DC61_9ACTN
MIARPPGPAADEPAAGPEVDATLADTIAALAIGVPGVSRLHGGLFGEVATYLPGRRVAGVTVHDEDVEVHVVLDASAPIRATAERVHAALATAVDLPVRVVVEDIDPS